ncbi:MAG: Cytochrome c biogenesis ATP-binding export protein CcmA [Holosporales bacterium]
MLVLKNLKDSRITKSMHHPICLNLQKGEALAITGNNGCGKTTLLRMIVSILEPESFDALYLNENYSYLPSQSPFYSDLKVSDYIRGPLPFLNNDPTNLEISELSSGQKRQLALYLFIKESKNFWIIDEPTAHLDDTSINSFYERVDHHCQSGGSVLITTHDFFPSFFKELNLNI